MTDTGSGKTIYFIVTDGFCTKIDLKAVNIEGKQMTLESIGQIDRIPRMERTILRLDKSDATTTTDNSLTTVVIVILNKICCEACIKLNLLET